MKTSQQAEESSSRMENSGKQQTVGRQWRGLIEEYRVRLPVTAATPVVTLGEGGTPLVAAPTLSERTGCEVYLKVEGANPTGSFKDRGMTMAISKAAEAGARAVICASTGNTSASAAAYAVRAGMVCAVLVPQGKIALGKMSQALVHGARILQVDGNFDDCLELARGLSESYPVALVNSVNPFRIEGQKTAAFEIVDALGDAPDVHCLPVGNAGNITAYWKGYTEYAAAGLSTRRPRMFGFQAAGAAPFVHGAPVADPQTIATAIRIGNPASWDLAIAAREESGGLIEAVTDRQILSAYKLLSTQEGVFVEPASAAGVAGLLLAREQDWLPSGLLVVCTVTGNGLKDPEWAINGGCRYRPTRPATPTSPPRPSSVWREREVEPVFRAQGAVRVPSPRRPAPTSAPASTPSAWPSSCATRSVARSSTAASRSRSTARAPATLPRDEDAPGRALDAGRLRPRSACSRPGFGCTAATGSRTVAAWAPPRRRSSPGWSVPGRCSSRARSGSTTPARSTWPPGSRVIRTTSPPACSAGSPSPGPSRTAWTWSAGRPTPGSAPVVFVPPSRTGDQAVARGLLPATVPHADAAANSARAALLVARADRAARSSC